MTPAPVPSAAPAPADRFPACVAFVMRWEGGYVEDPDDPGGCTKHGITIATLRAWRRDPRLTCADVASMHEAEARAIYAVHYWQAIRAGELPAGVDLAVFDLAVNSGRRRAGLILQQALGVKQDGWIGPVTLAAAAAQKPAGTIDAVCDLRGDFLTGLPHFPRFGRGWMRRLSACRLSAKDMAL